MGLFDGIGDVELYERGKYFPPGFRGILQIERTIAKDTRKSGVGFIVELRVMSVDRPGDPEHELSPVREGEKRTWFQKMDRKDVAFRALCEWAAAVAGYETNDNEAIKNEIMPELQAVLTYATDSPADNDFVKALVGVATEATITKEKKQNFTRHNWFPVNEREAEPRDAVDEIGGAS